MKKISYLLLLLCLQSFAQEVIFFNNDSINRIDANNNKKGIWKIYDLKRNIVVSGQIKNNEKFEEVNYFIEGKLFATQKNDSILIFYNDQEKIHTQFSRKNRSMPIIKDNGEPIDDEIKKKYFQSAELPAMFYGGSAAIAQYVEKNIAPNHKRKSGRVVVSVVINKDGIIEQPMIVNSDNPELNDEAIRLIKNMPRWQPGFQQGYFVRTTMRIPINFKS